MAQSKTCSSCGKNKPLTEYHKMSKAKDGLQYRCKSCMSIEGKRFRKDRPEYYPTYFKGNPNHTERVKKWGYGNTTKVYVIQTPEGDYIGCTTQNIKKRKADHKNHFRAVVGLNNYFRYPLPELHSVLMNLPHKEALECIDNLTVLEEIKGRDTDKAIQLEQKWIDKWETEGKPLLNIYKTNKIDR